MSHSSVVRTLRSAALALALAGSASAQYMRPETIPPPADRRPDLLANVGIDQRLNEMLPLDAPFRDENGATVTLRQYLGKKPVILALVYYECPMLCTQVLNGLTSALTVLKFDVGKQFDVVTVSFDPRETPQLAAEKKRAYVKRYQRTGTEGGWHFLTGEKASIGALTAATGFRYAWDPQTEQFAHGSGIMVITPEGRIAQYYYGIEYPARDLRLALVEASKNRIGNVIDQVMLYCFHYDPTTGRYGAIAMNMIRLGGVVTVLVLGSFIVIMLRRESQGRVPGGRTA